MPRIGDGNLPDQPMSRRTKLAFGGLIFVFIAIFAVGLGLLIQADHRRTTEEARVQVTHTAELLERSVESSLANANMRMWDIIARLAASPLGEAAVAQETYGSLLRRTVDSIPQIDSLVLIAPDGLVLAATVDGLVGKSVADRGYFKQAKELGHLQYAVGVPISSRATGRRVTPIAWPLLDEEGTLRGLLASSLGETYFADLLSSTGYRSDVVVTIVTANGDVAFASAEPSFDRSATAISASRVIPALDLTVTVSRSRAAAFADFEERTTAFVLVSVTLFASALGMAVSSLLKSFRLTEGLRRVSRAQREFDAIFQNVADGIVIFDETTTFHRSNRKARELLGAKDDRDAVASLKALLPPAGDIGAEPTSYRLALDAFEDDDEDRAVQARVMTIAHHGHRVLYCVLADLTADERVSAMRESFITSVNHELRTPLTSLAGSLEILQARFGADLPASALRLVDMAARNADRLLMLVNDILTLQAIDQGQLDIRMEPLAVSSVLAEAVHANAGYGMGAKVELRSDPPPVETWIEADRNRLQQVLANIISNAIKYSPKGGAVVIGASVGDGSVDLWVKDRGPGIPEQARERLFERFARPVHGRDVQASGTGLGLAITNELSKRQGAEISFSSRSIEDDPLNHGTTFSLTFGTREDRRSPREAAA